MFERIEDMKTILKHLTFLAVALAVGGAVAYAGSLTPPGAPADTMYTLDNIYNLATGATTTVGSGTIPATPGTASPTFHTLAQIYSAISGQIGNLSSSTIATGTTAFGITGSKVPSKLLQTGSNDYCSNMTGTLVSCAGTGEDGQYSIGQPHSYTDNGDLTVTDNNTGLMWPKCSFGLSGSDCSTGVAQFVNFDQATSSCMTQSLAGHSDWRVPNVNELYSLVVLDNSSTPLITSYFPRTNLANYWSSSIAKTDLANLFVVNFQSGLISTSGINGGRGYTRCVRSLP